MVKKPQDYVLISNEKLLIYYWTRIYRYTGISLRSRRSDIGWKRSVTRPSYVESIA